MLNCLPIYPFLPHAKTQSKSDRIPHPKYRTPPPNHHFLSHAPDAENTEKSHTIIISICDILEHRTNKVKST
jgi:hypothetical protein